MKRVETCMSSKLIAVYTSSITAIMILFTGCFLMNPDDTDRADESVKLFIVESDYHSGALERMSIEQKELNSSAIPVYNDAVIKFYDGCLYVLERFGADNFMKIDFSKTGKSAIAYQNHLGNNFNPQDIAFLSSQKAYISNQDKPLITIFNPSTGDTISSIDISDYTFLPARNTTPYAGEMELDGRDLYVMLQRRDGYEPGASTLILKIDTSKDLIVDTIAMKYKNGFSMELHDGALYVSNPGDLKLGDGAVEKVNLTDKTVSTVLRDDVLGGNPNQIVHKEGSRFYITSYVEYPDVKVLEIDVSSKKVIKDLPGVKNAYGGICYDDVDGKLYVAERDPEEAGVRIYKNNLQEGTTVKTSLPPNGLVVGR